MNKNINTNTGKTGKNVEDMCYGFQSYACKNTSADWLGRPVRSQQAKG